MGLLDDAIREHLDLKRRRGADPAEVARLEHEALGPVRREPAPAEQAPAAEEHHDEPRADAHEQAHEPHPAAEQLHPDEHTHVLTPEERHEPPHGDPLFEQHAHNVELGGAAAHEPHAEEPDAAPEPEPDAPHADALDQPTTEYRVEAHHDDHEDPHQPDGEDVLEETPEFLQETPEHDRLWFEQRPPRDFDFDG
ncbi:MAG: hypothetical protein JSS99_01340 [Actinobacteria bacterium]|nr:hypothetical protein [Actinomycetota bacterium]